MGKEILFKTILQAIPNYVMSLFLLPKGTCEDLEKFFADFWWGIDLFFADISIWFDQWIQNPRNRFVSTVFSPDKHVFMLRDLIKQESWDKDLSSYSSIDTRHKSQLA